MTIMVMRLLLLYSVLYHGTAELFVCLSSILICRKEFEFLWTQSGQKHIVQAYSTLEIVLGSIVVFCILFLEDNLTYWTQSDQTLVLTGCGDFVVVGISKWLMMHWCGVISVALMSGLPSTVRAQNTPATDPTVVSVVLCHVSKPPTDQ